MKTPSMKEFTRRIGIQKEKSSRTLLDMLKRRRQNTAEQGKHQEIVHNLSANDVLAATLFDDEAFNDVDTE